MIVESLESRRMFSVSVNQAGPILFVRGDAGDDLLTISELGGEVVVDGSAPYTGVKLIIAALGNGSNELFFDVDTTPLIVSTGSGDDLIIGTIASTADVVINAGSGWNTVSVIGSGVGDSVRISGGLVTDTIMVSTVEETSINGGGGDDIISVSGGTNVRINGGAGGDTITVENSGTTIILGGSGNDIIDASASTGDIIIIGGGGEDVITAPLTATIIY